MIRAGRPLPPSGRPSVKRKIAEFDERRFDESRPFDAPPAPADLVAVADRMVNRVRLAPARSKVGTDPAAVADEVVLDVLVDLADAVPAAMVALDAVSEPPCRSTYGAPFRLVDGLGVTGRCVHDDDPVIRGVGQIPDAGAAGDFVLSLGGFRPW